MRLDVGMPFHNARKYVDITAGGAAFCIISKLRTKRDATNLGGPWKFRLLTFERIRSSISQGISFFASAILLLLEVLQSYIQIDFDSTLVREVPIFTKQLGV